MLKVEFTNEVIFGFSGPNLCLLGTPSDFKLLGKTVIPLTSIGNTQTIEITDLEYVEQTGEKIKLLFSSRPTANHFGKMIENDTVWFELDNGYWQRLVKFFAILSWDKKTYYLNSFEDALRDLPLDQEIHLICSSEF